MTKPAAKKPAAKKRVAKPLTMKPAAKKPAAEPAALPMWALPTWAKAKPAEGALPVPGKVRDAISKALGPLDRQYAITRTVGMLATHGSPRNVPAWGLHRMLSVADGAGPEVARVFEQLALHELPLVAVDFWYPRGTTDDGTVAGAAAIFEAGLAPASVAHLTRLTVLLHRVSLEVPIAKVLARAIERMPALRVLGLFARGGEGALTVAEACPPLQALELRDLGAQQLEALARLSAVTELEALTLTGIDADDAAVTSLLGTPWARGLRSLELSPRALEARDYRAVRSLDALTSLNLRFPDEATVAAIADADFAPHLTRLELHDCRIALPVAKRLAARGLPQLERLFVKRAELSDAALRVLVDAAPRLKELGIPKTTTPQQWTKRGRQVL